MDRSEIIKKAISKMEKPYTDVCVNLYKTLKANGLTIAEDTWRKISSDLCSGMNVAFEAGMNAYADCVDETVKQSRFEKYYAQDMRYHANAKRCRKNALAEKAQSEEVYFKYLMESNNDKKKELFNEYTRHERHCKKWWELADHFKEILREHGFKWRYLWNC